MGDSQGSQRGIPSTALRIDLSEKMRRFQNQQLKFSFMSEVLWDVALDKDGSRIWIREYCGEDVYCPECEGKMIAVRGEIVQHHYRHDSESNCSGESAKHWSKKYEIADALDGMGEVEVEGKIGKFVADVLFEKKWAFEVVFSNPPSDEKMNKMKESLIVFNFNDRTVWDEENHNPHLHQFSHIDPTPSDLSEIVKTFGKDIISKSELDVCSVCREVKGCNSRAKSDGRCPSCDMEYSFPDEYDFAYLIMGRSKKSFPDIANIGWIRRKGKIIPTEKVTTLSIPLKRIHRVPVIPKGTPIFCGFVTNRPGGARNRETDIFACGESIEESIFNPNNKTVKIEARIRSFASRLTSKKLSPKGRGELPTFLWRMKKPNREGRWISEEYALEVESLERD